MWRQRSVTSYIDERRRARRCSCGVRLAQEHVAPLALNRVKTPHARETPCRALSFCKLDAPLFASLLNGPLALVGPFSPSNQPKCAGFKLNKDSGKLQKPEKQRYHYDLTIFAGGTTLDAVQGRKGCCHEEDVL